MIFFNLKYSSTFFVELKAKRDISWDLMMKTERNVEKH